MEMAELTSKLKAAAPGALLQKSPFGRSESPSIWVELQSLPAVARFLKEDPSLRLDWVENLSVAQFDDTLVITYFLRSTTTGQSLIVRGSSVPKSAETKVSLPSISGVWPMARHFEVEAAELFGMDFGGLQKEEFEILPREWSGFPLRKEYAFPLQYAGLDHRRGADS